MKKLKKLKEKYRYSLILLKELVKTEFKLRYQGSVLGYLWAVLKPLFLFLILYVVFVYFMRIGGDIPHWPVAMLLGIVLWTFFAEVTNMGLAAVVNRGDIIRKINFPKYVIVLASSISAFINLAINLVVIGVFMAINGVEITSLALLTPLYILEIFVFGLGIAFLLGALYVKFRDIAYIWEIIMQGLFYMSAVIFPMSMVVAMNATVAKLLLLNPVAQAIQDARYTLITTDIVTLGTLVHNPWIHLIPFAIVIVTFVFGAWYFKKQSATFAENL